MNLKRSLQAYFIVVLLLMTYVSVYATYDGWSGQMKNVMLGFKEVWNLPWGMATLFDAYFAFAAFFLWVAYKEKSSLAKGIWFILIMSLGNFAIAAYMLIQLSRLKKKQGIKELLIQKN